MRLRAALMATLLNFIVCLTFLIVCSTTAAKLQNEIIDEELRMTCRLSTEMLDSAAFQDNPEKLLSGVAGEGDMLVAYFSSSGMVVYKSFDYEARLPLESEASGASGGVYSFERVNPAGDKLLCAARTLSDGSVLCYGKRAVVWHRSLSGYGWLFSLIVLSCLIIQFTVVARSVGLSDKMVASIMRVLEDFSEGKFDSRITGVTAASQSVAAQYNATLGRVQDRVFRQQRRNRVLGQMLNQMKNGLITVDKDLNLTFASKMVGELFGVNIPADEIVPLKSVLDNPGLEKVLSEAMVERSGAVCTCDTDGLLPNGGNRPLRVYASSMFRADKASGALAVIEDITHLHNLENLRTDFAANVSHEMKTPLTSIKGFVETLQDGAVDDPIMARKFLKIILIETDRLTRLINDILSITKLESGMESVDIQRLNLDRMVMEVCELLKIHADEKEVQINAYPGEQPSYVMGNADRVKQLLINLIENAIKYNKEGGSVTIKLFKDAQNINLCVADTGIGIQEEHLAHLFERFYRVDKGRSRAMGGTGLGLAIVRHIVISMNGMIEVHTKYGEGTEFLVTLPRAPIEEIPAELMGDIQDADSKP